MSSHPDQRLPRAAALAFIAPTSRLLALCACCVALLGSATCADPVEPENFAGTFALVDVNGVAPPLAVPKATDLGVGLRTIVVADTLVFQGGGVGRWIHVAFRETIDGGTRVDDVSWTWCSRYERTRQALYVRFRQCGSGGDWDFGDDAVLITEDSLIRGHYGAWRYVRVTPADAP